MAEERESFENQWASSDVTEENLKEMVAHGVLPAKEIIGIASGIRRSIPDPRHSWKSWYFSHFFYGGIFSSHLKVLPGEILDFYGDQVYIT
jgi:Putative gypsy type transposon.